MKNYINSYIKYFKYIEKPFWLKVKIPFGKKYNNIKKIINQNSINTICESGNCPNIHECWSNNTATFMILGDICTRSCLFCAVKTGKPLYYNNINELNNICKAIKLMNIKHIVITSVNRDELNDMGAKFWYNIIIKIKEKYPFITIETLIPDLNSKWNFLYKIINSGQNIISFNIETIQRLYKAIKPQSKYFRSLEQIQRIKLYGKKNKSSIILGLGEKIFEVQDLIDDLIEYGLDTLTIGQYLCPSNINLEVFEYIYPEVFIFFKQKSLNKGLKYIESGPLIRSSYNSKKYI